MGVERFSGPARMTYDHIWRHRIWPRRSWEGSRQVDERYGQPCRVLARGRNGNVLVQFEDGALIVGVRYCVRRKG